MNRRGASECVRPVSARQSLEPFSIWDPRHRGQPGGHFMLKNLVLCSMALTFVALTQLNAAASKDARVTQIIRDVKLLPSEADARAAALNDRVAEDTGVRTGEQSRTELTFA